ncbi:hypothetical protein ACFV10_11945 [Streptomyces cyaneofuscatus]|uniref:hypothetical protein n=1 Tax=Streptomyces cyaneofuscatus TaxID=66883 RepID=UPI00369C62A9
MNAPRLRTLPRSRPRTRPRRSRRARAAVVVAVPLGVAALLWLWYGTPYPAADPDRAAVRLKGEAQRAYDEAALPGRPGVGPVRVDTGTCYYRGLRSVAHIDQGRSDVRSFGLDWRVTGVAEDAARSGQERTRARLEREGWTVVSTDERGFRYRLPGGEGADEDIVDVEWHHETGTYSVSVFTDCGKLPDGFDEYRWPEAEWDPRKAPSTPPAPRPATPR